MTRFVRASFLASIALVIGIPTAGAGEIEHAIGLSYSSGVADVFSYYGDLPSVTTTGALPLGLSYRALIKVKGNIRADVGVGPLALVLGDISYLDVPIQATVGWTFLRNEDVSPYARAGLMAHFVNGDYLDDSTAIGLLVAGGVQFRNVSRWKIFVEGAYDTSRLTFRYPHVEREDVSPMGFMLTAGVVLAF